MNVGECTGMRATTRPSLLLDTNIWLDYYLAQRPGHKAACDLLAYACAHNVDLLYATSASKDVFYLISAHLKRLARAEAGDTLSEGAATAAAQAAWACLENMDELACAVGYDQSDIWIARRRRALHTDYEDNLVVAAAMRANATCLVTNDETLVRHSPVATLSAADALAFLQTSQ